MKIEVLVASMNQQNHDLIKKMNIQTDAIIGNQCEHNSIENLNINNLNITYLNFNERGVGLNRNNALLRSKADICIFADDDMIFYDFYEKEIEQLFANNPKVDMFILNIDESDVSERRRLNNKIKKVNFFNYMNYGAARICVRREILSYNSIYFNLNFGGGTQHSSGEDSLFIWECIKKKLNVCTAPISIAKLDNSRESSWFKGYNEKYFYDKGVFLGIAHPLLCKLLAKYLLLKHKEYFSESKLTKKQIRAKIKEGINYARKFK